MKPIIGVVGRPNKEKKATITVIDNYRTAIIKAGGIPVLILPPQVIDYYDTKLDEIKPLTNEEKLMIKAQVDLVDGIVITGGNKMYEFDRYICYLADQKPLLGICMGMQTMCRYDNDNINIKNESAFHLQPEVDLVHKVKIDRNSHLYKIIKEEEFMVNSRHSYHVQNAGGYNVCGVSEDNLIEAIEKPGLPFNIGVQWHPEKNFDNDLISQRLFKEFIEQSKKATLLRSR